MILGALAGALHLAMSVESPSVDSRSFSKFDNLFNFEIVRIHHSLLLTETITSCFFYLLS